jgi:hypothetical protein
MKQIHQKDIYDPSPQVNPDSQLKEFLLDQDDISMSAFSQLIQLQDHHHMHRSNTTH